SWFSSRDQLDDSQSTFEWPASPVLRDMAEHAVLDLVPLRRARWIVVDVERQAGLVCELLQFHFPEAHARAVRAAAIRSDRQFAHVGIALAADALDPGTDRLHRELRRIARDAEADPAGVGADVVDAVGDDLTEGLRVPSSSCRPR